MIKLTDKTKIVNLTPHPINIRLINTLIIGIEASGNVARVQNTFKKVGGLSNGIDVFEVEYGDIEGLPDPVDDTIYIVSNLVAQRCLDREDVFIPGPPIRDDRGVIIGCTGISHL